MKIFLSASLLIAVLFQLDCTPAQAAEFKWVAWKNAPERTKEFIRKRDAHIYKNIHTSIDETWVDVRDLDLDKKNDVIISIRSDLYCGSHGCSFYVIPGDARKKTLSFNAEHVTPVRRGIKADAIINKF